MIWKGVHRSITTERTSAQNSVSLNFFVMKHTSQKKMLKEEKDIPKPQKANLPCSSSDISIYFLRSSNFFLIHNHFHY